MTRKWEYDVIPFPEATKGIDELKKALNEKGNEGWELIAIFNHPQHEKFYYDKTISSFAFFKR